MKDGSDVAVISIGTIASEVKEAIKLAENEGVSIAHYDAIFLKPIDEEMLHEIGRMNRPVITVEDASVIGGLGSAVAEWMADNGYSPRIIRIGVPDNFVHQGTVAQLKKLCHLDPQSIAERIIEAGKEADK